MQKVNSTSIRPAISFPAARLSFAMGAAALVLLAALHVLSPEIDPAWRMASEYAGGSYGWVLSLMFLAWALGSFTLLIALRPHLRTVGGKIGLGFLFVSAIGTAMAIFFDFRHSLHGLATLLGIPTFPVAALLISAGLARSQAFSSGRRSLLGLANLTWMSLALMLVMLFTGLSQTGGEFGPSVLIGWPNRLVVLTYCGWLMAAAWRVIRPDRE